HDSGRYCHLIAERLAVLVQMNGPLNIGQPPEKDYGDWWTRFKRQMDGVKVTAGSEATPVFQQQNVAELKGVIMDTAAMIATVEKRKNPDFSIGDAADRVEQFFYETTKIDKFQD